MRVMAHRGLSSQAPENTLAAFSKAIEFGCTWIELDVQLTVDGIPVVFHDETLERCTSGSGKVTAMTCAQIRRFSAGEWFSAAFHNEMVPTLEEVLTLVLAHSIKVNIELKPYPGDDVIALCQAVTEVIHRVGIASEQVLVSSFNVSALQTLHRLLPECQRGLLWQEMPDNAFTLLNMLEAYSVHCDYRYLSEEQAVRIKNQGYQLYCYTPNDPTEVQAHWQWGVDMMITDTPQRYSAFSQPV